MGLGHTDRGARHRRLAGRARLQVGSTIPVVGGKTIELRFVPGVKSASLIGGDPPEIPTAPGGDVAQIMRQVSDVAGKVDSLPLGTIADNVKQATQQIASVTSSPALHQTIQNLDETMTNLRHVSADARAQVAPLLEQIRRTADQVTATATAARSLVGGQGGGAPEEAGMPQALYELTQAARSLRELADMLDRHPEAILSGKVPRQ